MSDDDMKLIPAMRRFRDAEYGGVETLPAGILRAFRAGYFAGSDAEIIRREHATPAQVEGRMNDSNLLRIREYADSLDDLAPLGPFAAFNLKDTVKEADRARASESALLARAEADARRVVADEDLAEAMKVCEAATPEPWETRYYDRVALPDDVDGKRSIVHCYSTEIDGKYLPCTANANFIALARTLLPRILPELQSLRERVKRAMEIPEPKPDAERTNDYERGADYGAACVWEQFRTILTGASGEKAGVCGTCGGVEVEHSSEHGVVNKEILHAPDCNGTGQATEANA